MDGRDCLVDRRDEGSARSLKQHTLIPSSVNRNQEWSRLGWNEVVPLLGEMGEKMEAFSARSKKLPTRLRDWEAFKQLRQRIEDYQTLLPLLQVRQ